VSFRAVPSGLRAVEVRPVPPRSAWFVCKSLHQGKQSDKNTALDFFPIDRDQSVLLERAIGRARAHQTPWSGAESWFVEHRTLRFARANSLSKGLSTELLARLVVARLAWCGPVGAPSRIARQPRDAVLSALAYWALVSRAVDIVPLVLSAVGGIGVLFVGVLLFSFMATPATLAFEKHVEQEGGAEPWGVSVSPVPGGPLVLRFVTRNLAERYLHAETKTPLVALRFTNPVERVIRETDLPAEIRLPRRGKLVV
jgi:hypothetical protein